MQVIQATDGHLIRLLFSLSFLLFSILETVEISQMLFAIIIIHDYRTYYSTIPSLVPYPLSQITCG